jgi:glycosyltransferase involved in cell wall biosynthesis
MRARVNVVIIGPSTRFLSGVSYYTIRLSNALADVTDVKTLLFRKMLLKRLFPGWRRVGEELTTQNFDPRVNVYEILDWYNPLTWLSAFRQAKDADVIVMQWWTSSVAHMYFVLELLNSRRRPIVIEFHEVVDPLERSILPIRIYSKLMGRVIRRLASWYVVHSNSDKELISTNYGIEKETITVIPHGLYDHYQKMERTVAKSTLGVREEFVILFFGLLRPYKGVKYLIQAFESLPEDLVKRSRLLIVGETWEDKESKKLASGSEFSGKITVVDRYVHDAELSLYLSAADVLVIPYVRASQSGVAHIGMAFGIPIIASEVGGLKESLGKYDGTVFVRPGSADALTEALMQVFAEQKEFVPPQELRWSEIAQKWLNLIESVKA